MSTWNEEEDGAGWGGLLPSAEEKRAERIEAARLARENEKLTMAYAEGRKDEREVWGPVLEALDFVVNAYEGSPPNERTMGFYEARNRARAAIKAVTGEQA